MKALQRLVVVLVMVLALATAGAASNYTILDLGTLPGGNSSQALGINDSGKIVGWSDWLGYVHGCTWWGEDRTISELGGPDSSATGVNDSGEIVGWSGTTDGYLFHAWLWQDGTIIDLGMLPGENSSQANGINDSGQIVGFSGTSSGNSYACLWQDGTITDLGTLPGGGSSEAWGINNSGQIVGYAYTSSGSWHACLWEPTQHLEAVDPLQGIPSLSNLVTHAGGLVSPDADLSLLPNLVQQLATQGRRVSGAAADGATRVLLRARLAGRGSVTFSLYDPAAPGGGPVEPGTLTDIAGNKSGAYGVAVEADAVSATDGYYAFALYQAPDGCPGMDRDGLSFDIWATFTDEHGDTSQLGPLTLFLYQPPVLLLHGLWSNPSMWGPFPLITDDRFPVVLAPLYPGAGPFTTTSREMKQWARNACAAMRTRGWASSRVDIIGHSMGGLVARHLASQTNWSEPL